jgi:hypothetical protein
MARLPIVVERTDHLDLKNIIRTRPKPSCAFVSPISPFPYPSALNIPYPPSLMLLNLACGASVRPSLVLAVSSERTLYCCRNRLHHWSG